MFAWRETVDTLFLTRVLLGLGIFHHLLGKEEWDENPSSLSARLRMVVEKKKTLESSSDNETISVIFGGLRGPFHQK